MKTPLRYYFWILRRRCRALAALFALCFGAAYLYDETVPKSYSASAKLLFENAAPSVEETDPRQMLAMVEHIVSAAPNLESIRKSNSELLGNFDTYQLREAVTFDSGNPRAKVSLIDVQTNLPDPEASVLFANAIAESVKLQYEKLLRNRAEQALEFYQAELDRLRVILNEKSEALAEFISDNARQHPEHLPFYLYRRNQVLKTLSETRLDTGPRVSFANLALRNELRNDIAVLSEQHPNFRRLKSQIEQIESGESTSGVLELDKVAVPSLEQELFELNRYLEQIPEVALVLGEFEREQSLVEAQYAQLIEAYSTAVETERREALKKGDSLRIIEFASEPLSNELTQRKITYFAATVAALFLSLVSIIFLEKSDRTLRRPIDLERSLGIAAYAVLPVNQPLKRLSK